VGFETRIASIGCRCSVSCDCLCKYFVILFFYCFLRRAEIEFEMTTLTMNEGILVH